MADRKSKSTAEQIEEIVKQAIEEFDALVIERGVVLSDDEVAEARAGSACVEPPPTWLH